MFILFLWLCHASSCSNSPLGFRLLCSLTVMFWQVRAAQPYRFSPRQAKCISTKRFKATRQSEGSVCPARQSEGSVCPAMKRLKRSKTNPVWSVSSGSDFRFWCCTPTPQQRALGAYSIQAIHVIKAIFESHGFSGLIIHIALKQREFWLKLTKCNVMHRDNVRHCAKVSSKILGVTVLVA